MNLGDILNEITKISQDIGASTPFICGGTPRDKYMNKVEEVADIDITTGDDTIHHIAKEASIRFRGPNASYKEMGDGHATLVVDGIKIDFSSNFVVPGIDQLLTNAGLKNPTDMQKELYSRDFTCNALLMSMDLKKILDPIGLGIQDINSKILRTCLPAKITLGIDNKRIVRAIYLAAKLKFKLDDEIKKWIKENPEKINVEDKGYVTKKLNQALEYDPKITVGLLDELGLWRVVPPSDQLTKYMTEDVRRI